MKKFHLEHHTYYIIELCTLLFGFFLVAKFSFNIFLQLLILLATLIFYVLLGVMHHKIHHTLKIKIMIEYVLVSALIFAAFLFLNSARL